MREFTEKQSKVCCGYYKDFGRSQQQQPTYLNPVGWLSHHYRHPLPPIPALGSEPSSGHEAFWENRLLPFSRCQFTETTLVKPSVNIDLAQKLTSSPTFPHGGMHLRHTWKNAGIRGREGTLKLSAQHSLSTLTDHMFKSLSMEAIFIKAL